MNNKKLITTVLFLMAIVRSCGAMVYDNRFMPLYQRLWIAPDDGRSHAAFNFFIVTGTMAYNQLGQEVPLPQIFGDYDLGKLATGMTKIGCCNPLKSEWQGANIPWFVLGKLEGQAIELEYQQSLHTYVSLGASVMIMRLNSWFDFILKPRNEVTLDLTANDIAELDDARRYVHQSLGLCGDHSCQIGFGDTDLYIRVGNYWDYVLKFRSIQAGARFGFLIPTSDRRNLSYPSWIPFGGNGHWGIYGALDATFEIKEDWKCGCLLRLNKRFGRTQCERIPINCEPDVFGIVQAPVYVDPGATFIFSPFVAFESLRDGFGLRVFYTLIKHESDYWGVPKTSCAPCVINPGRACRRSAWGSDYFSANLFYDFGKDKPDCRIYPIITFCWDIPAALLMADSVAKTHRISLGVEVSF